MVSPIDLTSVIRTSAERLNALIKEEINNRNNSSEQVSPVDERINLQPEEVEQLVENAIEATTGGAAITFRVSKDFPLMIEVIDVETQEVITTVPPASLRDDYDVSLIDVMV